MDRATAIDKIRKCMRLARSSNPHEAAAALRQAQALMREFGIEDADLLAAEAGEARARSRAARNPVSWEVCLVYMVAECFGCDVIFVAATGAAFDSVLKILGRRPTASGRHGEYALIGAGPRPEIASYVFSVLLRQALRARETYIRKHLNRCRAASKTRRADEFCMYWVVAVCKKVQALVPSAGELQAVAAFKAKHYPETTEGEGRRRSGGNPLDRAHGYVEGENAQLHHGVPGAAAPLLGVRG